jgi:antiviral helicase SKI2
MLQAHVLTQPKSLKELTPGRILLVSHKEHVNKLGILLFLDTSKQENVFKVLVLCSDEKAKTNGPGDDIHFCVASDKEKPEEQSEHDPLWYKMLGLASKHKIFVPDGVGGHTVLTLKANDIVGILKEKVNVDSNLVFQDWEKRQIPRFR